MTLDDFNEIIIKEDSYEYFKNNKEELFSLFPILKKADGFNQYNDHHIYDVFTHLLMTLKYIKKRTLLLCIAALFHDIGKPSTFTRDENGVGHFYNHSKAGSIMILDILKDYYDKDFIKNVSLLIEYHDYPIKSNKTIKRALDALGEDLIFDLFDLKKADILAHNPKYSYVVDELDEVVLNIKNYINK